MSMTPNGGLGPTGNSGLGPTGATLPVWDTVAQAFASSIRQPRGLLWSVVGIWAVILAALQIVLGLTDPVATGAETVAGDATQAEVGPNAALNLIASLVGLVAFIDIAVVWTRYLVLEEEPQRFLDGRLNRRRWAYLLRLLLLIVATAGFAVGALMLFTLGAGIGPEAGSGQLAIVLIPVMLLAIYIMFGRFGLYFTGAALGDPRMSLNASWRLSGANALRLTMAVIAVAIIAVIAIGAATLVISSILAFISPFLAIVVGSIVLAAGNVWSYLVQHAVLARAYLLLVPEPAPGTLTL